MQRGPLLSRNRITTAISTADSVIAPGNVRRTGLIISPPTAGTALITFGEPASATNGIALASTSNPLVVNPDEYGNWIQEEIHAFGSAPASITVYEIFDPGLVRGMPNAKQSP